MIIIVVVAAIFIILAVCRRKRKRLDPLGTITMVTGAVKVGKSSLAVWLAIKSYYIARFRWFVLRIFPSHKNDEKPLLYSNIPLKIPYVPLTEDILLRKVRIAYKSICLIDECSLCADSQLIHNNDVNEQLLLFYKLYGHYSHGGSLICDTQSIDDNHYALRRCVNSYIYASKSYKFLPFVMILNVVEQRYSSDGTVVATDVKDIDDITKHIIVPKFVWKLFDTYCYSVFTDSLPVYKDLKKSDSLKTDHIVSFRKSFSALRQLKPSVFGVDKTDETDSK